MMMMIMLQFGQANAWWHMTMTVFIISYAECRLPNGAIVHPSVPINLLYITAGPESPRPLPHNRREIGFVHY